MTEKSETRHPESEPSSTSDREIRNPAPRVPTQPNFGQRKPKPGYPESEPGPTSDREIQNLVSKPEPRPALTKETTSPSAQFNLIE